MTVYFIGAGPGDPDLLTLKAARLIAACPVCLYAGSLVPEAVIAHAPKRARVMDTASMTLADTHGEIVEAHDAGKMLRASIPAIPHFTARLPSRSGCCAPITSPSKSSRAFQPMRRLRRPLGKN